MEILVKMPGLIRFYTVKEGDRVQAGDQLASMEAMQVEHKILAPAAGVIKKITAPVKERISAGTIIMVMDNMVTDKQGGRYLFAGRADFAAYKKAVSVCDFSIENNSLLIAGQVVSALVPVQHVKEAVENINRLSLEPERKMPSYGWRFELYKDKDGFLQEEFTKAEWRKANVEYVGVSFSVASPFEREDARPLVSYFQPGGLLEEIAPNVYYRYDRLFAKYGGRPAVFTIEDVPDLADFLQNYMPELYKDLLETATYELLQNFDARPYVEKIIKNHYTYKI